MTDPTPLPAIPAKLPRAIATVFGLGFVRVAPGTVASLVTLPLAWLVATIGGRISVLLLAILITAIGSWACELYVRRTGSVDPSECVIDEVAGQMLVCAFLPSPARFTIFWAYFLAFVLFRIFDITKMWPINVVERRVPGGLGVMADDIVAALFAAVVIAILAHIGLV